MIFCGDLNVAHTEIDLANPKANIHNHGFTAEERAGFDAFVRAGFLDTFREFEPGGGHYTWWSVMGGARSRNVGWRIDYFLISKSLRPRLKRAFMELTHGQRSLSRRHRAGFMNDCRSRRKEACFWPANRWFLMKIETRYLVSYKRQVFFRKILAADFKTKMPSCFW